MDNTAHSPTSLLIVICVAFVVPFILHRLRWSAVPLVVAEIIAGMLIGKTGLNIVHEDEWLSILSLLGLIFLMFLSGLEIDFDSFSSKNGGKKTNPLFIAIVAFVLVFIASFAVSFGLSWMGLMMPVWFMTLIISTISLGVVVPVLKERKMMDTALGQTILLIAVISDFVTMILLAIFVSFQAKDSTKPLLLLALFAVTFGLYRIIKIFHRHSSAALDKLSRGTVQIGMRGVFLLIILFVALSEKMGAENIIGAFLAGVIVSALSPKKEFVRQLDAFGYGFLIPIFFVMVGAKLNLWMLLKNQQVYLFIPLLLVALYVSKVTPLLVLRRWFSWKQTISAGTLLTSTLSLVIAATALALDLKMIDQLLHDSLILVAILTCLISPIVFNRTAPAEELTRTSVGIVGLNRITLPVALELKQEGYDVTLYTQKNGPTEIQEYMKMNPKLQNQFEAVSALPDFTRKTLEANCVFDKDILVLTTSDNERNLELAYHAKEKGCRQIIVRMEDFERQEEVKKEGFTLFSTLFSASTLLKSLVESPTAFEFITRKHDVLQTITVGNRRYNGASLRNLPFLGDALILRIYRNDDSIVPHGYTILQVGDRLLATGSLESLRALKDELQ